MAYPYRVNEGDIWSGLMSRKKRPPFLSPYSNLSGNIYVPPANMPEYGMDPQSNRWRDIEKSPNLRKWGNLGATSQTPTAPFGGGIGKSAYQGVGSKKKGNKLKYIVEALREMEGETPGPLPGRDRVGGTRPGMPGYTPTNMGAYVGDPVAMQAAIAEARRKKEKESLMNLLGGGY